MKLIWIADRRAFGPHLKTARLDAYGRCGRQYPSGVEQMHPRGTAIWFWRRFWWRNCVPEGKRRPNRSNRRYWQTTGSAVVALALVLFFGTASAWAQDQILDAIRIGALAHDIIASHRSEHGTDVNAELQFQPLDLWRDDSAPAWLDSLLDPRPVLGASINTAGYTSQLYAGVTWQMNLWRHVLSADDLVYSELSLGGVIHNGRLNAGSTHREALGSRVLFHLSGEFGYAIDAHYTVGIYYEHASNAGLARYNRSLNDAGLRLGYRF